MEEMNIKQLSLDNSLSFVGGESFPQELYSTCEQYLQGLMQLRAEPTPFPDIIYGLLPERPARKLLAFLDGKNITTLRYHRLLEVAPQKAQLFIDNALAHYDMALMKDSPKGRVSYAEFLAQINEAIMRLFRESLEGADFTPSINDPYKEQAASLESDELYGVLYRAMKAGDKEPIYLSAQSEQWLSYDALIEEYFTLNMPAVMEGEIVYEDGKPIGQICSSPKPIGYGNTDKFTWLRHHDDRSQHKALFDAISQLELTQLNPATFMMLLDMGR